MPVLKRIELLAKLLLALLSAALLFRPWRKARALRLVGGARRILLVRIDDRVGEALLTTPLLQRLASVDPAPEVHVLLHQRVARVLEGHPLAARVVAFDRRHLWAGPLSPAIRALRQERYDVVVNCANWEVPSVTSGLVSRLIAGPSALVGPAVWPVGLLADLPIQARADTVREVEQRLHLLGPLGLPATLAPLSFRVPRIGAHFEPFLARVKSAPHAVINPGGRLGWRRIAPEVFAEAARALLEEGRTPIITYGPKEETLAADLTARVPGAVLAPPTDLDELAALMAAAGLTVCNNTGPMHLSVAVGAATLALFLKMPPERWGYPEAPHRMLDLTGVPDSQVAARVREEACALARYLSGRASSMSITGMSSLIS